MGLKNVGYHTTIKEIEEGIRRGFSTFQVFDGSPRRYNQPSANGLEAYTGLVDVVVHSPYWVSLAKEIADKAYIRTLEYTINETRLLDSKGVKYYVTHIGSRSEGMSIRRSYECLKEFCVKWLLSTSGCNIILCLENDSGSKKGTRMGSVKLLSKLIREVNSPRVRMTFDTEHAYANGFDLSKLHSIEEISDLISVVHLNSIPHGVERGSHLDRHSSTSLESCKEGFSYITNVYKLLDNDERPFIFEVGEAFIVDSNVRLIKSLV